MQTSEDQKIQLNKRVVAASVFLVLAAIFSIFIAQSFLKVDATSVSGGNLLSFSAEPSIAFTPEIQSVSNDTQDVYVHVSGQPIGIAITANGLIVVDVGAVNTESGEVFPARDVGIVTGDVIKSIDGQSVNSIYQLKKILSETTKSPLQIVFERDGKTFDRQITPAKDKITGQFKLGVALKEDVGGIGTLTFVTKDRQFAALGHHIADSESGLDEELRGGFIYKTSIDEVVKGEVGKAGGLVAGVNRLSSPIGEINANVDIGLYGKYKEQADGQLFRVAMKGEAKPGHAQVLTTVEGEEPRFYDVEIVKVISQSEPGDKGMVILVSDKELLKKTGGIVQGMSGSPIVQNGALIGAVTHVFIQDPTRGYAVHARFMLDEAKKILTDKNQKIGNLNSINIDDIKLVA
ncbi:MAG: SpoIVB peptidase [Clostridia bacterium]|nr:SpoIVB peptidase [Clostridia bacterium]